MLSARFLAYHAEEKKPTFICNRCLVGVKVSAETTSRSVFKALTPFSLGFATLLMQNVLPFLSLHIFRNYVIRTCISLT